MSNFLRLPLLICLLGVGPTMIACGDDEKSSKSDKDDEDDKKKGGEMSAADICENMSKFAEEKPTDDEMKECEEGVSELKDMLGDKWPETAECLAEAKSEEDAEECAATAVKAAMEKEMEKQLDADE